MTANKKLNLKYKYGIFVIISVILVISLYHVYFLNLNNRREALFNECFKVIGSFRCKEPLKLITISPNSEELFALTYLGEVYSYSVTDGKQIEHICDIDDKLYDPIYMYIDDSKTLYFLDNEVPSEPRTVSCSDNKVVLTRTIFYPTQAKYLGNYKIKYIKTNEKHSDEFQPINLNLSIFPTLNPSPQSKLVFVDENLYFLDSSLVDLNNFSVNFKQIPFSEYGKNKLLHINLKTKQIDTYLDTPPSSTAIISFDIQEDKLVLLTRTNKKELKQVGNEILVYNCKKEIIEKQFSLKIDCNDIYFISTDKLIAVNNDSLLLIDIDKQREIANINVSTSLSWFVKNPTGFYLVRRDGNNDNQYNIYKFIGK